MSPAAKKERKRRLDIMARVHGEWVRHADPPDRMPHCDCSRCMMSGPRTKVVNGQVVYDY